MPDQASSGPAAGTLLAGLTKSPVAMSGRHLTMLAAFGVTAGTALATAGALAADPAGTEIVAPTDGQLVVSASVPVEVRTARSAHVLRVSLDGRPLVRVLREVHAGVWRATLSSKRLAAGANHLVVVTTGDAGRRSYAAVRLIRGRRRPSFLTVSAPASGASSVVVSLRTTGRADLLLDARLNGTPLRGLAPSPAITSRRMRLGADDGLRFGRNVLRVLAAHRDGTYDVEQRKIFISRDRPLAGAGPDRRTTGGAAVMLDGSSSRAARPGMRLRYRWQVVRRPKGSRARPLRSASMRTPFRPDAIGTYRLRLLVSEAPRHESRAGAAAAAVGYDETTVDNVADAPPIGVPIDTMLANGKSGAEADSAIRVGGQTYWLGAPAGNAVQAVILDRTTLEPLYSRSYAGTQANAEELAAKIKSYEDPIVAIANPRLRPGPGAGKAFAALVKSLGANVAGLEEGRAGWSVVGVPGSTEGAYLALGTNPQPSEGAEQAGKLSGYLQRDSALQFTFVPAARVPFASSFAATPLRSTIQVGAAGYASAPLESCASGSLQVVVVLAETLAPVSNSTFATNGCGATADAQEQQRLATMLAQVSLASSGGEGAKLVFVQSSGTPRDPSTTSSWNEIATQLERLGGTAAVFAADSGSYALVGGLGVANLPLTESSSALTGAAAQINGLLQPNRLGSFTPVLSSPTGATPFDLAAIAYQPAEAWPYSETTEQKAALRYIAESVLKLPAPTVGSSCYVPAVPDVRSEYCELNLRHEWTGNWLTELKGPYPPGHGFDGETWTNVTGELAKEFRAVAMVWNLVETLQTPFGAAGVNAQVDLKGLTTEVEQALGATPRHEAAGFWLNFAGTLAGMAAYFTGADIQPAVGTLSGALMISGQFQYGPEGSPLLGRFQLAANDVASSLATNYGNASQGIGELADLIVSDHGKLMAVANDPEIGINTPTLGALKTELELGSRQWIYETLLPAAYEAVELERGEVMNNPLPTNAAKFECEWSEIGTAGGYFPFEKTPAQAQYAPQAPSARLGVLVAAGSELPGTGSEVYPPSPPATLLEPIFAPQSHGGANVPKPWFWRAAFDYPAGTKERIRCH